MKRLLLLLTTSVIITSCSTHRLVENSTDSQDYRVNSNQTNLILRPLMADLSIENVRKEITYSNQNIFSIEDLKANAIQLFLKTHFCDYVVDPIFSITKTMERSKVKEITIILTGFPAMYTKIYQVDSLPKSVLQNQEIDKSPKRLDYINSFKKTESKIENSQLTLGINLGLLKPLKGSSNTQFGASFVCKYNLNENFRIGANTGYYFNDTLSFRQVTFTIPITGSFEYCFSNNTFSPYIGTDIGYYLTGYYAKYSGVTTSGHFGFAPSLGLNSEQLT